MTLSRTLVVFAAALLAGPAAAADVDFARDVLPILSDNCFFCHGPDPKTREAGFRIDTKDGAFRAKKDRAMIVPGKSGDSEVIRRVFAADPDDRMPPSDSNRKLTSAQADTLKRWVDQGAKWDQHWAFTPLPKDVPVPAAPDARSPIDAFIRARLAKEGLSPAPEASRETWLRRVSLDLTGLPPTVAEIDAFLADTSPTAHETVVDRLLSGPRYAERMASDWLDLARFADTAGYQADRLRPMWAYRDWVLRSFGRNQRFDEFLTWQLAGDLLPNATKDQRLATAFNRLHMQNEEGGVVEEEFRVAYVVDRVDTMGTAFLGLTFECCRCHDHKFDPLTQKDFYSLFALFQNVDESGQTSYFTNAMPVPTLLLSTDAQDAKAAGLRAAVAAKEAALAKAREAARAGFPAWRAALPAGSLPLPGLVGHYPLDELKGNKTPNAADGKHPGTGHDGPKLVPGKDGQAVELSGENGFEFPGVGHFTRSDPFTLALWLKPAALAPREVILHHSKAPIDAGSRGYELLLEDGHVAFGLHHMWPGDSLKVRTKIAVKPGEWTHVGATHDGSGTAAGVMVFVNGVPTELDVVRDKLTKDITYGGEPNLALGYRFRDAGFKGGGADDLRVYNRALTRPEAAQLAGAPGENDLFDTFAATENAGVKSAAEELRIARKALAGLLEPIPEAMVMAEMSAPKPAFVLTRGAYDALGERVGPATPAALPPFPADLPRNRLGLAKWMTQTDHPLTARVTVNRLWQQMFGKGLVETSDNFGTTGTPPTHPDLLDWLARDFVQHGWDVKRCLKQIALSGTYRQSSRTSADLRAKDPYNQWLARFPARRLTAEMLRDQALFAGGLLVEKSGGPSVYPVQPAGLWDEAMGRPHYPQSKGADAHRRSLYTVWKRTAPHPQMTTFDAADRSVCSARRQSTSTPLQALALLNDPQIVEAAKALGQRMLAEGGATTADRAAYLFRTATGRQPTGRETAVLVRLFEEQKAALGTEADAAAALGLAVLNHDEAVNRR